MVEFTCAVPASGLTSFAISTTPTVGDSVIDGSDLPNGDRQVTLSFIAPSDQTSINIVCVEEWNLKATIEQHVISMQIVIIVFL